jgi:hypothetical protein
MQAQINWENFCACNHDARGIRFKFEDLCRQLFVHENISGNKQFKYLHSNPNNAGLETEPIYDEVNNRWIGFQAKYFDNVVDYSQIKDSANKTVEHYSGKVDYIFLFSNKPLKQKSLIPTGHVLNTNQINLELVTNEAILDLVREKYPYLGYYYFGNHSIKQEWFETYTNYMFAELGERYNRVFNVDTEASDEISLFVHDQKAAEYLNAKKTRLLKETNDLYYKVNMDRAYLKVIDLAVSELPDVDIETLYDSMQWKVEIEKTVASFLSRFSKKRSKLDLQRQEQSSLACDTSRSREERSDADKKYLELGAQIQSLDSLISLPTIVEITNRERGLLYGNVLSISGRAGTGKSQILACETKQLLDEDRVGLLLLAGIYFTDDPIQSQIMRNLHLDYNLEDLIDILETIGEKDNRIVPIFIDALNETWNKQLWKSGLPAIIDKIKRSQMVKLVLTYRSEYEKYILPDSMCQKMHSDEFITIHHRGFENNSIDAVRTFLDHYNIPFTPLEYFGYEMSNPLFLTLYCKTYNGEEISLPKLYERLIKQANANIYRTLETELRSKGYSEDDNILRPLITELASTLVFQNDRSISKSDLCGLKYWSEYGLTPAPFIRLLIKENLLHDSVFDNVERLYFSYDQMNDYYCAKALIETYGNNCDVRIYLSEKVLGIKDGKLGNSWNIDVFINACALYTEKYGKECIDIIDALTDDYDKWSVISRYISSFQWRNTRAVTTDNFREFLRTYPCEPDRLWEMLIGNSVKVSNPMNADFLHEFLSAYDLNRRDYIWTIYINKLPLDGSDRIVQLVEMYDRGEKLETANEKQVELLLTLFSWLLTSSNRWLRDYTSKAMIEILKEHFQLCQTILEKFYRVNDPYVIQRLFGVVFGACSKREKADNEYFQVLAEYVYNTYFNQEKVFPDILLRDYARMIVERFLYENPDYSGTIDRKKIIPPYNSDPIPELDDQHYLEREYHGATFWLMHSMRFEGMGMYGDFGRYVFQSALRNFDVDDKKLFNYAVYFILNELQYSEEYFGEHDKHCGRYDRFQTAKIERIGKKYQWIAMHNILARVSDHCKMVDCWSYPEKEDVQFEGAWEPYVRDFDPTLNQGFMICSEAPIFYSIDVFITAAIDENTHTDVSSAKQQKTWLDSKGVFHERLKETLLLNDEQGTEWVSLTAYHDTGRRDLDVEKPLVWSWLYAYFITPQQKEELVQCADNGLRIITHETASHNQTYSVFNREYPWAPSCKSFKEYAWVDAKINTGEKETVTETDCIPDLSTLDAFLKRLGYLSNSEEEPGDEQSEDEEPEALETESYKDDLQVTGDNDIEPPTITNEKVTHQVEVEKEIGKMLHATSTLMWEEEYDATKETAISWNVPCAMLLETLHLKQFDADGFYYDLDGKLAAFDADLTQKHNFFVIRRDLLDRFLEENDLKLVWLVDCQKEIHAFDRSISQWSEWEAVFTYEQGDIQGDIRRCRR